jgi:ADP-heptose:LPS heptosyltransferase
MKEKWCVIPDGGGLGDRICLVSAIRHFSKFQDDVRVGVDAQDVILRELISLYNDDLITFWERTWESSQQIWTTPANLNFKDNEVKWKVLNSFNLGPYARDITGKYGNYHGVYLAYLFNIIPHNPPNPELPKIKGILKGKIAIQPKSNWAKNPSDEFVQKMIDFCKEHTGEDVIALGNTNTPRNLKNVNYDFLKNDVSFLMSCINGLGLLLTPRSGCSHIAAGYQTPTILWNPDDGEEWHVNYEPWNVLKLRFETTEQNDDKIKNFIKDIIK